MVLSTLELSQLRADAADYWPDTCTIQVVTRTADGRGGWTEAWTDTYTSVACRLVPMAAGWGEVRESEQITSLTTWILTVAYNQTIDESMRVVHDSETYEVERMEDTHSNRTARRVYLRRAD